MPGPSINDVNSFSDILNPPLCFPVPSVDSVIMVLRFNPEIVELLFPYFMDKISYFHRIHLEIIKSICQLYYHFENSLKLTTTTYNYSVVSIKRAGPDHTVHCMVRPCSLNRYHRVTPNPPLQKYLLYISNKIHCLSKGLTIFILFNAYLTKLCHHFLVSNIHRKKCHHCLTSPPSSKKNDSNDIIKIQL